MTVSDVLNVFPGLKKASFIHDNCIIEEIDLKEPGSWWEMRKHFDEKVTRVFAMAEDEIRIDSK